MYKPSAKEQEFFAQLDAQRKAKLEAQHQKHIAETERKRLKELHHMKCPKCGMDLFEVDYKGVKIDECAECEGIWLDAKELDSILGMEKSAAGRLLDFFKKGS